MISTKSISTTSERSTKSFKQGLAAKLHIPYPAFGFESLKMSKMFEYMIMNQSLELLCNMHEIPF